MNQSSKNRMYTIVQRNCTFDCLLLNNSQKLQLFLTTAKEPKKRYQKIYDEFYFQQEFQQFEISLYNLFQILINQRQINFFNGTLTIFISQKELKINMTQISENQFKNDFKLASQVLAQYENHIRSQLMQGVQKVISDSKNWVQNFHIKKPLKNQQNAEQNQMQQENIAIEENQKQDKQLILEKQIPTFQKQNNKQSQLKKTFVMNKINNIDIIKKSGSDNFVQTQNKLVLKKFEAKKNQLIINYPMNFKNKSSYTIKIDTLGQPGITLGVVQVGNIRTHHTKAAYTYNNVSGVITQCKQSPLTKKSINNAKTIKVMLIDNQIVWQINQTQTISFKPQRMVAGPAYYPFIELYTEGDTIQLISLSK